MHLTLVRMQFSPAKWQSLLHKDCLEKTAAAFDGSHCSSCRRLAPTIRCCNNSQWNPTQDHWQRNDFLAQSKQTLSKTDCKEKKALRFSEWHSWLRQKSWSNGTWLPFLGDSGERTEVPDLTLSIDLLATPMWQWSSVRSLTRKRLCPCSIKDKSLRKKLYTDCPLSLLTPVHFTFLQQLSKHSVFFRGHKDNTERPSNRRWLYLGIVYRGAVHSVIEWLWSLGLFPHLLRGSITHSAAWLSKLASASVERPLWVFAVSRSQAAPNGFQCQKWTKSMGSFKDLIVSWP